MISDLKRRARARARVRADLAGDPTARFAYDLATRPPYKDVASLKAASHLHEAARDTTADEAATHEPLCRRAHELFRVPGKP